METISLTYQTNNPYYKYLLMKYKEYGLDYIISTIIRDEYYNYLGEKYNEYDLDDLIDMISEEENTIREKYERACWENRFNKCV